LDNISPDSGPTSPESYDDPKNEQLKIIKGQIDELKTDSNDKIEIQ